MVVIYFGKARFMDDKTLAAVLRALAQPSRLRIVKLLIAAGETGLEAGEIASRLGLVQNTFSTHAALLRRAGLVFSQREGRRIRYIAERVSITAAGEAIARLAADRATSRSSGSAPSRARPD